tara:strand:+ start:1248 stop:2696 length:1449 start_codon:yes stop_codon:yes gene_type:complete
MPNTKEQLAIFSRQDAINRRTFLETSANGCGAAALGSLLCRNQTNATGSIGRANFAPKAKRVIYLFQSGGPSQMDLFDPKPELEKQRGKELPESVLGKQRLTGMTSNQKTLPVAPTNYHFAPRGISGIELSDLLPNLSGVADDLCLIRSMHSEAINHDPAITFLQTGFQLSGRPSIGSWMSYGLGAVNRNLPSYIVLTSRGGSSDAQPLYSRLWASGFLPTEHSGVKFRNTGDPVYYLSNPSGISRIMRRDMLDDLANLNQQRLGVIGDPEIQSRIAQYEMAFRMQSSVPELTDVSGESEKVLKLYGPDVKKPGSYAANCLLARRLAERDVRFIQLFHMGWDHHFKLSQDLPRQCRDTDHPTAGLIRDLKQRGLLDETLIVWGGEFGRTIYAQAPDKNGGRDHHPRCFTFMLAGGGVNKGYVHGATDDYCYNVSLNPVHVHDLNATILHQMGLNHERLTYKYQGRQYRLTDVHGKVVHDILA